MQELLWIGWGVSYLQVIVTIVIGVLAWQVQRRVLATHKEKLRADSFERKYAIYEELHRFLIGVINYQRPVIPQPIMLVENFGRLGLFHQYIVIKAKFLYPPSVIEFMEEIIHVCSQLSIQRNEVLQIANGQRLVIGEDPTRTVSQLEARLLELFDRKFTVFAPHLNMLQGE